jgi:hypothetical protein
VLTTQLLSPTERKIDAALETNITASIESVLDLLAALLLCIIAVLSLAHAVVRLAFALLGWLLWCLALLVTGLYWCRSWLASKSSSSLHSPSSSEFCHDEIEREESTEHGS